jgi:hypothetical protein
MITPEDIAARAKRAYGLFLRTWLHGEAWTPIVFPTGSLPTDYSALRSGVAKLVGCAKKPRSHGYRIELTTRQTRAFGAQSLPSQIIIDTPDDLLHVADKVEEFAAFQRDVALIRAVLPDLDAP